MNSISLILRQLAEVTRTTLVTLLLPIILAAGPASIQDAIAEDSGSDSSSGHRGKIRAACGPVTDSTGRDVSSDRLHESTRLPLGPCAEAKTGQPSTSVQRREKIPATPTPIAESIQVGEPLDDERKRASSSVDPVGIGFALVSSGLLYGFLSSGWLASLLLLGLPIWRDLDLLAIVARRPAKDAAGRDDPPDADEESLFSREIKNIESDSASLRVRT